MTVPAMRKSADFPCSRGLDCVHGAANHEARRRDTAHLVRQNRPFFQVNARGSGGQRDVQPVVHQNLGRRPADTRDQIDRTSVGQLGGFEVGFTDLDEVDAGAGGGRDLLREARRSIASGPRPMAAPSRRRSVTRHRIIADCGCRIAD